MQIKFGSDWGKRHPGEPSQFELIAAHYGKVPTYLTNIHFALLGFWINFSWPSKDALWERIRMEIRDEKRPREEDWN